MTTLKGVIAAAPTPLRDDFSIDLDRLVAHCHWLLGEGGCDGVNLLGTTGEATSFSVEQRLAAMRAVARSGIALERMMVGSGASALEDAVTLTREARDLGFAGALVIPPFYYKGIEGGSLAAYVGQVIARAGASGLRLYLYHIPQNTGVPFDADTVERLLDSAGGTVVGLKDSSGDIAFSRALAARFPSFDVFPSSEGSLAEAREAGFAGCISATTNITGAHAQTAWSQQGTAEGRSAAHCAMAIRTILAGFPLVASVKAALSELTGDGAWERVVPPLRSLTAAERAEMLALLEPAGFA